MTTPQLYLATKLVLIPSAPEFFISRPKSYQWLMNPFLKYNMTYRNADVVEPSFGSSDSEDILYCKATRI